MRLTKYLGIALNLILLVLIVNLDKAVYLIFKNSSPYLPSYALTGFVKDEINTFLWFSLPLLIALCSIQLYYQIKKIQQFRFTLIIGFTMMFFAGMHIWMLSGIDQVTAIYTYPTSIIYPINILFMMYALSGLVQFIRTRFNLDNMGRQDVLDDVPLD